MTANDNNNPNPTKEEQLVELAARPNGKKIAEQNARLDTELWIHELAREKIKETMVGNSPEPTINTEEAIKLVWKDPKTLDLIAEHFAKHNPEWDKMFKESPKHLKEELDKAIAEAESFD